MQQIQRVGLLLVLLTLSLAPSPGWAQNGPQTFVVQLGPDVGRNQGLVWHDESDWNYRFDGQVKLPFGNYVGVETGLWAGCRSYLYFPLNELPEGEEIDIQAATLEIYVNDWPFEGSGAFGVYQVLADWTEPFSWTMRPPVAPTSVFSQTITSTEGWTEWIVTDLVQAWADGTANHGLMLAAAPSPETEGGWAVAAPGRLSDEEPDRFPKLTIVYEIVQPAPTPSPAPTTQPESPPVVPEASTFVLLVSASSGLASYIGLQLRKRRRHSGF